MPTIKRKGTSAAARTDPHVLYEAAVQAVDADIAFMRRVFRRLRGRAPLSVREDFCGTAQLAATWAAARPANVAWGVDLDAATLEWAQHRRLDHLRSVARRVHLVRGDVCTVRVPPVDIVAAFNFSYFVFKERQQLLRYFRHVRRGLKPDGILVFDLFGGTSSYRALDEKRKIRGGRAPDGSRVPSFVYHWEHARFDAITHSILCHIHFRFADGSQQRKAFTYDWRVWTLPELRDLLREAGFRETRVYSHGFDPAGESDGVYRERPALENTEGWLAYVVGVK